MSTAVIILVLCFSVASAIPPPRLPCSKDACQPEKGPVKLYKDLQCKPVFREIGDCCPVKYDCNHIEDRSINKCYAFGKEYSRNEEVSFEDRGCAPPCTCHQGPKEVAGFVCALASPIPPPRPGCYRPRNATNCGLGTEVCFNEPDTMPTCKADEKVIQAGGYFEPETEPKKACWCNAGWNDNKNGDVFCEDITERNCGAELHHAFKIKWFCAPVFTVGQSPGSDCNYEWRCPEPDDKVIPREEVGGVSQDRFPDESEEDRCKFGNEMTLRFGDEVHLVEGGKCIKCSCHLPPFLTCWSLPESECTKN